MGHKDIAKTMLAPTKKINTSVALGYKQALDDIQDRWVGNSDVLETSTVKKYTDMAYVGVFARYKDTLRPTQPSIRQLLNYLENQTEHPVVHAGIALGMLSGMILPPEDPGLIARLVACAFLAKDGYDLRGMGTPEYQWAHDAVSYVTALRTIRTQGNLNHWLLYVAQSIETDYTKRAEYISSTLWRRSPVDFRLNERQRAILHLLDNPELSITNKMVQKRFHISQITASRDLSRLSVLSLIAVHGKGRSVSYTGI
jgi:Fic family protein